MASSWCRRSEARAGSSPRSANVQHGPTAEPRCCFCRGSPSTWTTAGIRLYAVPAEGGSPDGTGSSQCCRMATGNGSASIPMAGFQPQELTTIRAPASTRFPVPATTWSSRTSQPFAGAPERGLWRAIPIQLEPHRRSAVRRGHGEGHRQSMACGRRSSDARLAFGRTPDDGWRPRHQRRALTGREPDRLRATVNRQRACGLFLLMLLMVDSRVREHHFRKMEPGLASSISQRRQCCGLQRRASRRATSEIWVHHFDTSQHQLVILDGVTPKWIPGGNSIVYQKWRSGTAISRR